MKCVYSHTFSGEARPFFVGSGTISRSKMLALRLPGWRAVVGSRVADVQVRIIEMHACEGRARMRECVLIGEMNPLGNVIAATRPSPDLLTGRAKGGRDCSCGNADCWQKLWESMSSVEREDMIEEHYRRVKANKAARKS